MRPPVSLLHRRDIKEGAKKGARLQRNSINWGGHVFKQMRNYSDNHKCTSIGNVSRARCLSLWARWPQSARHEHSCQ